jgi:hypothetical protein
MLVPARRRAVAAAAMMRFSSAVGARERVKRIGAGATLGATGGALLPFRIEAGTAHGSLLSELAEASGHELVCTLTLGTVRANRKPVLQLFTPRGRGIAFAKVGLTDRADRDVRTEHRNLAMLSSAGPSGVLQVPRVLDFREWHGHPVLVMTQLRTPALERGRATSADLHATMDRFARHFDAGTVPLSEVPLLRHLDAAVDALPGQDVRQQLRAALDRLAEQAGSTPVPVGAWHGDWTPWNMARARDGLQLWDWERFETGVPVGFDRCHFEVNTALVDRGLSTASVRSGIAAAGFSAAGPGSRDHAVVGLYLVAILYRYLQDGTELPPRVRQRVTVLGEVLDSWLAVR